MLKHYAAFFTLLIASVSAQDKPVGRMSSASTSECLDVGDFANIKNGNPILMNECSDSVSQVWEISPGATVVRLADPNLSVKYCLDAINVDSGNFAVIWECNQNPQQQWVATPTGRLTLAKNTNLCLEAPPADSSTENGVQVPTAECNDDDLNQVWNLI